MVSCFGWESQVLEYFVGVTVDLIHNDIDIKVSVAENINLSEGYMADQRLFLQGKEYN